MPTIASLIVRIGANDQQIQSALAAVGQKAKSVDADLKKLGGTALGAKAEASLKDLKATMDGITKAQERVAEKARLMAAGLEAMGGAAKLTDKELKQVQRTLNEGISAYEALGKKAPAELQKVADAVKGKLDAPMGSAQHEDDRARHRARHGARQRGGANRAVRCSRRRKRRSPTAMRSRI